MDVIVELLRLIVAVLASVGSVAADPPPPPRPDLPPSIAPEATAPPEVVDDPVATEAPVPGVPYLCGEGVVAFGLGQETLPAGCVPAPPELLPPDEPDWVEGWERWGPRPDE